MVSIARFDLHGLVTLVRSFVLPFFQVNLCKIRENPLIKNRTQASKPAVSYCIDTSIKDLEICPKADRP